MPWTPGTWGPPFWKTIHITALYIDYLFMSKPQEALQRWDKFLHGITNGLPCIQCETHFRSYQKEQPPPRSSQGFENPQFLRWTIQAHNDVRAETTKSCQRKKTLSKRIWTVEYSRWHHRHTTCRLPRHCPSMRVPS